VQRLLAQIAFSFPILLLLSLPSPGGEPISDRSEQFFDLPLTGAINVENTDGTINVVGWYKPRVRLAIVRKAYTTNRLRQIRVETKSSPNSLSIRTIIPEIKGLFADRSGTVGYTITVPEPSQLTLKLANGEVSLEGLRGGNAKVELTNGRITAINCFAQVEARTTQGLMEIFFDWWENFPSRFNYILGQGRIAARLPAAAAFQLSAQTNDGRIQNSFGLPAPPKPNPGQTLTAAHGSNPIASLEMKARNGNILVEATR
jgi:hypothetical protein